MHAYALECICIRRHLKETVLWGIPSRGLKGKRNIQTKKIDSKKWFFKILLGNPGALWPRWKLWIVKWMFRTLWPCGELKEKFSLYRSSTARVLLITSGVSNFPKKGEKPLWTGYFRFTLKTNVRQITLSWWHPYRTPLLYGQPLVSELERSRYSASYTSSILF